MVGTKELAAVADRVVERGGSVRLLGDDQQLNAVAASGVFRDLAELGSALGTTVRLTELHRFSEAEEAAATLGIRAGDPAALEHYLSKGRVHVGVTKTGGTLSLRRAGRLLGWDVSPPRGLRMTIRCRKED